MTSYNAIPYESLPISYTHLPFLAALGRLYGLETATPEKCRVLELGCAEGSNIIPMAWYWPNSHFLGIDISEVQIASGQAHIDALALKNIQLKIEDLTALNSSQYAQFDYILVHGVFSWVTHETQEQILALGQSLLTDNGMMYISYNTYPGWHNQMTLRDAFIMRCEGLTEPQARVKKLSEALTFFKRFFAAADNDFSAFYTSRLRDLEAHSSSYIYHEFLEAHNNPLYFKDFIHRAKQHELQYVADAYLPIDNPILLGKERYSYIKDFDDRIQRLQYTDYMINQRFRRSLICQQHASLRAEFSPQEMTSIAYRGNLLAKRTPSLSNSRNSSFYVVTDPKVFITISHPVTKAAILILAEAYPSSLSYADLLQQSCQQVVNSGGLKFIEKIEDYYQELYLLVIDDWLSIDTEAREFPTINWDQPFKISELVWRIASTDGYMPTPLQKAIDIDPLGLEALRLLRKGLTREQLFKKITIIIQQNSELKLDRSQRKPKNIKYQLNQFLDALQRNALINNIVI